MAADLEILLTNDDGIDAPGIRALATALADVGSVTVVAPRDNQSAVGRSLSYGRTAAETTDEALQATFEDGSFTSPVPHTDHELGYAVDGTPCDCAIVGVNALDPEPDLVVSGCNAGANLGAYVFSRSGTVSAAMEAAFLGTPAIAISMDTLGLPDPIEPADFDRAARLTADLVRSVATSDPFQRVDYLNVNVPRPDRELAGVAITRPTEVYEMDAVYENGRFSLTNELWQQMANRDIPDPPDTARYALLDHQVSISPMAIPYDPVDRDGVAATIENALDDVADGR